MERDESDSLGGEEESDYLSSDDELQTEFSEGRLKPGLIVRTVSKKEPTNDIPGLELQISNLKRKELAWLERMDVTSTVVRSNIEDETASNGQELDAEDDFKREMHFFQQAQTSVVAGLKKLDELGVAYLRPEDYFAEMMKTDDHMKKVRQSLLSRQKILEQKEKARKQRELRKYGKKVQLEILQKRKSEKKASVESMAQNFKKKKSKMGEKNNRESKKRISEGEKVVRGKKKFQGNKKFQKGGSDMSDKIGRGNKSQRGGRSKGGKFSGGKKKGKPVRLGKSRRNKRK